MKKITGTSIFWGVALIIIALLLVFNAVGVKAGFLDVGGLPIIRIILGAFCVASIVYSIAKGKIAQIFFPLAFIALLFEGEIARLFNAASEDLYSVWLVLGVAALLTAGISILTPSRAEISVNNKDKIGKNNLSSAAKYIDCTDFGTKSVGNNLGYMAVYFENADKYEGGGTLVIDNNLGSTAVYIPGDWDPDVTVDHNLGSLRVPDTRANATKGVRIVAKSNLGSLKIFYDDETESSDK